MAEYKNIKITQEFLESGLTIQKKVDVILEIPVLSILPQIGDQVEATGVFGYVNYVYVSNNRAVIYIERTNITAYTSFVKFIYEQLMSEEFKSSLYSFLPNLKDITISAPSEFGEGEKKIMEQIKLCHQMAKEHLYLGFQIDECAKMNYKNQYKPHQIFTFDHWQDN